MRFFSTLVASTLGAILAILLFLFFGFVFILAIAASTDATPAVPSGSVLVLELGVDIPDQVTGDQFAQALGLEAPYGLFDVTEGLRKAAVDDRIEALWIRARGSALSWTAASELRRSISKFGESGKPIFASSEDYPLNENALFVASTADSLFAGPGALVEFNGFYILSEFYRGLLDKIDVEPQIVRAGGFKSAVEPFERTSLSDENRLQLGAILETQEQAFVEAISSDRGLTEDDVRGIMAGFGLGSAEEAVERGLIDGIRHRDQVVSSIETALGEQADGDLRTVTMADYVRVPAARAGVSTTGNAEIAVVFMHGLMVSGTGSRPGFLTPASVRGALRTARDSDRVKAVVLRIDSPGGSSAAADAILRDITTTASEKPLLVSMGGVAASGGYWIAMAADTIVAEEQTLTGSIGVYSMFFDVGDLYADNLGITHDLVRTGPQADMLSGLRPYSAAERARMQSSVDETYQDFLRIVAEGRGMDVERVDELAQGRVWSGLDAKEVGLVDEIGGLRDAIEMAAKRAGLEPDGYRVRLLPRQPTLLERINRSFSATVARLRFPDGLSSLEWALLRQARQVESFLSESGSVQARYPFDVSIR